MESHQVKEMQLNRERQWKVKRLKMKLESLERFSN